MNLMTFFRSIEFICWARGVVAMHKFFVLVLMFNLTIKWRSSTAQQKLIAFAFSILWAGSVFGLFVVCFLLIPHFVRSAEIVKSLEDGRRAIIIFIIAVHRTLVKFNENINKMLYLYFDNKLYEDFASLFVTMMMMIMRLVFVQKHKNWVCLHIAKCAM